MSTQTPPGLDKQLAASYNSGMKKSRDNRPNGLIQSTTPKMLPPSPLNGVSLPASATWQTGVSGNPGGAPAGVRIGTWLARFGQMDPKDWPDLDDPKVRVPANARIALAQLKKAMKSEDGLPAAAWATERLEGKAEQNINLRATQEPTMTAEDAMKIIKDAEAAKLDNF